MQLIPEVREQWRLAGGKPMITRNLQQFEEAKLNRLPQSASYDRIGQTKAHH